jgi:hypothetical protein
MSGSTIGVQYAVELPDLPERDLLRGWARAALAAVERHGALAIRIVDEAESAALNGRWRGKHGPTNVLSFPAVLPPGLDVAELGDTLRIEIEETQRDLAWPDIPGTRPDLVEVQFLAQFQQAVVQVGVIDHQQPGDPAAIGKT